MTELDVSSNTFELANIPLLGQGGLEYPWLCAIRDAQNVARSKMKPDGT